MPSQPLWTPSAERIEKSNMMRFRAFLQEKNLLGDQDLWSWSVENKEDFWSAVAEFSEIKFHKQADSIFVDAEHATKTKWFSGAELNFAENLLRNRSEKEAIVFWSEKRERMSLTFNELYEQVRALSHFLKSKGIEPGDRIAGFVPNLPQAIVAMLAASSIGAVWSSCSPDFGFKGVMDRFGQIAPKILFTADGYYYNGKTIDSLGRVAEIESAIESIEEIIVIPFVSDSPDLGSLKKAVLLPEVLESVTNTDDIPFSYQDFDHPLFIMYSSGTTGVPKCIVHGAGGTLIQHLKEHLLHCDLKPEDKIFYFSTCGWMMWNWLVSALATGSTVLLYDGAPMVDEGSILFDFADAEGMTIFGTSAKFISAIEKAGMKPRESHDLSSIKAICSTGSTLLPESFDYVYRDIKEDVHLASISGGTDIISCFILGNPIKPVYRGEIQGRGLGMDVHVFDETGSEIVGSQGELVCTSPFPSMPIYFWNDESGEKYFNSYFAVYDNIWRHGDFAELSENGGFLMFGRSDATLNPGGVRIGTSEIYRQVEQLDEVIEGLVIGQSWEGDERVILFVKLSEGASLTDELVATIRKQIRENATPRHVPAKVIPVNDIPRTISGKIVELAVKNIIEGKPVKNTDALANPQALEQFKDLEELQS